MTGGAGFIGSAVAERFSTAGDDVAVLDSLHPQVHLGHWPQPADGVRAYLMDVTVPSHWDRLLNEFLPDVIIHLAAETGTAQSLSESSRHARVNVVGTAEMLDALTRAHHLPERFVLASSRAVYGEGSWRTAGGAVFAAVPRTGSQLASAQWDPVGPGGPGEPVQPVAQDGRTVPPRPSSIYAATKLAQEHLLSAWVVANGSALSILRLQNVYGPGQSLSNPYTGVVSFFMTTALSGRPIPVFEDGRILRDFVFIADVADALIAAVRKGGVGVGLFDFGSGRPITLLALAEEVARQAGGPAPVVTGDYRLGDVRAAFAEPSGARTLLDERSPVELSSGIAQLLTWVQDQAPQERPAGWRLLP